MKKRILALAGVLVLVAVLIVPMVVLAAVNDATQTASTSKADAINIRAQDYTTAVADITFPEGAPGATVSDPSNDQPETQILGAEGTAKPVVTLVNTSAVAYTVWYNIEAFSEGVVSSENYVIIAKGGECLNADAITESATLDGSDHVCTGTITTIAATGDGGEADERDLYLKITLSALAGKTGTSTLTILGES